MQFTKLLVLVPAFIAGTHAIAIPNEIAVPKSTDLPGPDMAPFDPPPKPPSPEWCGYIFHNPAFSQGPATLLKTSKTCTTVDKTIYGVLNNVCDLCVFFQQANCWGAITYWGGPTAPEQMMEGSHSYFCI